MTKQEIDAAIAVAEASIDRIGIYEIFAAGLVALGVLGEFALGYYRRTLDATLKPLRDQQAQVHETELAKLNLDTEKARMVAADLELQLQKARKQIEKVDARIVSLSATVRIDFSWPAGSNPIFFNENDSDRSPVEVFWLITPAGVAKLYGGYTITRTGPNSAVFETHVTPKSGELPLGKQIDTVFCASEFVSFIVLRNYWMNGRDQYPITVTGSSTEFTINDMRGSISTPLQLSIHPGPLATTIYGMLMVSQHIDGGVGSLFKHHKI